MIIALWIFHGFLCLVFLYSGIMKSTKTERELVMMRQTGVEGLNQNFIRFIGIAELFGAAGIILPWALGILPALTPAAAACFCVIMIAACYIHYRRLEFLTAAGNILLFVMALIVAVFRFRSL